MSELGRRTWRTCEPLHAMVYFAPEAQEEYAGVGLDVAGNPALGYFPARAAALGAVSPAVVHAVFFGFSPLAVAFGIDWSLASPGTVQEARWRGARRALERFLGSPDVVELAGLLREAAVACVPDGRPLAAANLALEWPDDPLLQVFHAQTVLREFRGDGHVQACLAAGLSGLDANLTHVAEGTGWSRRGLQRTRAWSDEEWDGALASLVERGWLQADGTFTPRGVELRAEVEAETDRLSAAPYEALGEAACARVRELARPLSAAVVEAGGLRIR